MISALVPIFVLLVMLYALIRRVDVFSAFCEGATGALPLIGTILPCLAAMLIAISVFRESGAMDFVVRLLEPLCDPIGFDARLLPLVLLRPFSGSAAMAINSDIMLKYGADSKVGYLASILVGASETVFYTVALYFGAIGVKRTRFTIPVAMLATLVSVVTGVIFGNLFYR